MLKLSSDREELQPTETEVWKCQTPNSVLEKLSNDLFYIGMSVSGTAEQGRRPKGIFDIRAHYEDAVCSISHWENRTHFISKAH